MSKRKPAAQAAFVPGDVVVDSRGYAGVVDEVSGSGVVFVLSSTTGLDPLPGHVLIRRRPARDLKRIGRISLEPHPTNAEA